MIPCNRFCLISARIDLILSHSHRGAIEVNARWSKWFEDVILSLVDEDGNLYGADEVWHLD